jgi:hypothetical protein
MLSKIMKIITPMTRKKQCNLALLLTKEKKVLIFQQLGVESGAGSASNDAEPLH